MKMVKIKLKTDKTITPVAQKHRTIQFHLSKKANDKLKRFFETRNMGISSHNCSQEGGGDIRLCVDIAQAKREHHVIPTGDKF